MSKTKKQAMDIINLQVVPTRKSAKGRRSGRQVMLQLAALVKPLLHVMLLAISMGLLGHLCATFIPILGVYALLESLDLATPFPLHIIWALLIACALIRAFLRYAEQWCNHFIAFKLLAIIRDQVFTALRRLCPAKLERKDKGNLISLITSDIELLEVFYAHTISPVAIALLFCSLLTVFIGTFHPLLAAIAGLAYVTVGLLIPWWITGRSGATGYVFRRKSADLASFVLDSLRGLPEILQYNCGEKRLQQMRERTESLSQVEHKMKSVGGYNFAVTNTVILVFDLLMLFVAGWLYSLGEVTFSGVVIPTIGLMSSFGPCVSLANLGSGLQHTFAAGNRVLDILEEEPQVLEIETMPQVSFDGAQVDQVTFAYPPVVSIEDTALSGGKVLAAGVTTMASGGPLVTAPVLQDVSLTIAPHSILTLRGKSGSGKSTLLKLLMRFWEVQQGTIKISSANIDQINTDNLRDMESYVTQETQLFHDTIRNNIKIAKLDADDREIEEACKKAAIHDFIMSLPQAYDTLVAELGDSLSGGEGQRIGLARAFLHDADLLLLDEPTSNLDSLNEAIILRAVRAIGKHKTVVLVSHRDSAQRIADQVYTVDSGRLS